MRDPNASAYVSEQKLEGPNGNPPMWHADEECGNLENAERVVEMTVAEAREECVRQARCCSAIPALEDLDA